MGKGKSNKNAGQQDEVMLENIDNDETLAARKKASSFRGANISLHDIHSCIVIIDVIGKRHGYEEGEQKSVDALRNRLAKFLNINVPEGYDMAANREETKAFAEMEQAKLKENRQADGSIDSENANRLEPSGGAPFPI